MRLWCIVELDRPIDAAAYGWICGNEWSCPKAGEAIDAPEYDWLYWEKGFPELKPLDRAPPPATKRQRGRGGNPPISASPRHYRPRYQSQTLNPIHCMGWASTLVGSDWGALGGIL